MQVKQRGASTVGVLVLLAIALLAVAGWVMNIAAIAHADMAHITGMLILRCIGIFVAPLGAVLGFF